MPIQVTPASTTFTGEGITRYRLLTLIAGLKLEIAGMRLSRGRSCYSIVKREFGFKGSRNVVLQQLEVYSRVQHMSVSVSKEPT